MQSEEEYLYYKQLLKLELLGIISNIEYEPKPFILFKGNDSLQRASYKIDFRFEWNAQYHKILYSFVDENNDKVPYTANRINGKDMQLIEIKPNVDVYKTSRLAKLKIKWVYEKFGQYIQIINKTKKELKKETSSLKLLLN